MFIANRPGWVCIPDDTTPARQPPGALNGLSGALNGLSGALNGLSGLAASTSAAGVLVGAEVAVGGGVLVGAGTGVAVAGGGGWVGVGVGSLPPQAAAITATIKIVNNKPAIQTR